MNKIKYSHLITHYLLSNPVNSLGAKRVEQSNEQKAFEHIISLLHKKYFQESEAEIELIRDFLLAHVAKKRGGFWQDPKRKAKAKAAMKQAAEQWRKENISLEVTWRSTGETIITSDYKEVAKLLRKQVSTIRCYLSKGKGKAHFTDSVKEDVVTVTRK